MCSSPASRTAREAIRCVAVDELAFLPIKICKAEKVQETLKNREPTNSAKKNTVEKLTETRKWVDRFDNNSIEFSPRSDSWKPLAFVRGPYLRER